VSITTAVRGRPALRRRKTLERKRAILRAAAAAFRRGGYHAASLDGIAGALFMTKGMLYHYFPSKQDILYFCQEASCDRLLEEAGRIDRLAFRADEKLVRVIEAQVHCMLDELYGSAAHLEVAALPAKKRERILAKRDRYERFIRSLVAGAIRSKVFFPCDPKLAAFAILGAINWTARWYRPEGSATPDQIAQTFARILVRGLKGSAS
jgi:AcrR family transcriptional regulator